MSDDIFGWKYTGNNRVMCSVLKEQRNIIKRLKALYPDQPALDSLLVGIEEIQAMGNRMEAALADQKDLNILRDAVHKMKRKAKRLNKLIKAQEKRLPKDES